MAEYTYEYGSYYLKEGAHIILMADEIALAFSYFKDDDGEMRAVLHKHGKPELVNNWYIKAVKSYEKAGFKEEARELVCIQGKFAVDELNKIISICDYIGRFYEKLQKWPEQLRQEN